MPPVATAPCTGTSTSLAVRWLGAPSPFGLALPDASPSPSTMYGPRGVWSDDDVCVAVDTGNHRVLVWHGGLPSEDHADADVVLGHDRMDAEGPGLLHVPTGVVVHDGRLVVCDAWHHRLLVWDEIPRRSGTPPDVVIGQTGIGGTEANGGRGEPDGTGFHWPYGVGFVDGWCWVADTGNRRVLGWQGWPEPGRAADVVLGQPSPHHHDENRGGPAGPSTFRWPHAVAGREGVLLVADAGNHRVLAWHGGLDGDRPADAVLGQPSFTTNAEFPYRPQGPRAVRFPYAMAVAGDRLVVGDTSNNRVLVWDRLPAAGDAGTPADHVLGQPDFDANGENRWRSVDRDTLCWPYGVHVHDDIVLVADSGNNRVVAWPLPDAIRPATSGLTAGPDGNGGAG